MCLHYALVSVESVAASSSFGPIAVWPMTPGVGMYKPLASASASAAPYVRLVGAGVGVSL